MLLRPLILFFLCLGFRYTSCTQMITEIDGIDFVFLFSTLCQLSCLTFISNRINEGVSGNPTNWPPHTSGIKYIPENPSIESPKLHAFLETLETFRVYFGCPFPGTVYSNRSFGPEKVLGLSRNSPFDRRSVITRFGCLICFDSVLIHCSGDALRVIGLFYFWAAEKQLPICDFLWTK